MASAHLRQWCLVPFNPRLRLQRAHRECADTLHGPILATLPDLIRLLNAVDNHVTAYLVAASPSRLDAPRIIGVNRAIRGVG